MESIKRLLRRLGVDAQRYNAIQSQPARLLWQLGQHGIDLVIDVGANCGQYGRTLREGGYDGSILSFEPLEDARKSLIQRAKNDERWIIGERAAVGADNGTIVMHVAGNSVSSSVLPMLDNHRNAAPQSAYIKDEIAPLRTLDTLALHVAQNHRSIFVKVDTQGFEKAVLDGAPQILRRARGLQLELSLLPLYHGQVLYEAMIDQVQRSGFQLWDVVPGFRTRDTGRLMQFDGIFFKP